MLISIKNKEPNKQKKQINKQQQTENKSKKGKHLGMVVKKNEKHFTAINTGNF